MKGPHEFVEHGYLNALLALEPEIRAAVEAEYAEQLRDASFWQRLRLRRAIRAEILRRLDRQAPPDALYLAR